MTAAVWNVGLATALSFSNAKKLSQKNQAPVDAAHLLSQVDILGLNEVDPAHHGLFGDKIQELIPSAAYYGSSAGDMIFWCAPQRAMSTPQSHLVSASTPGKFEI